MPLHREPLWQRLVCSSLALGVLALFLYAASTYRVPVHSGVDQNGYLVGAKQIAGTGTMKLRPTLPGTGELDPHQLVGRMWVGAELGTGRERFYPKYPIGLPLLYAIGLLAGGEARGFDVVYWISPVAMAVAGLGTYLLGRLLAGSIAGLVAMGLFLTAPVTLALTTNPNSHATATCSVVLGTYFLLTWHFRRSAWRALIAGFFLGYAVTIRYTEGTLLLPMAIVGLLTVLSRRAAPSAWPGLLVLGLGWLIPVGGLVIYNLVAMGTITGYDPTNESIGFSLSYAADNWETMLRQLSTSGLFFVLPLAVAGLIGAYWWNWRVSLVLTAWVLPCVAVYTFYYWAPDTSSVGYVRFFMTVLPALAVAAAWTIRRCTDFASEMGHPMAAVLPCAVVLAIASAGQLQQGLDLVETDHTNRISLQRTVREIDSIVPPNATIISPETGLCHHLQFVRDGLIYDGETFRRPYVANLLTQLELDEPQGLDPFRRAALHEKLGGMDQPALDREYQRVIEASLADGRRVFLAIPTREGLGLPRNLNDDVVRRGLPEWMRKRGKDFPFELKLVDAWNVPTVRPPTERAAPRARRTMLRPDRRLGHWFMIEVTRRGATQVSPPPTA